ncbi:hypothetical protein CRUP_003282 [Coryphaenoides rupestris]|nr:hypothetical protein CRUP_003282 [Coryphaenoides rupestris]
MEVAMLAMLMLRREVTSQLRMASHILVMTVSRSGSTMAHTSGPSNMMWESTPQALYDTSMPSASLSSRLLRGRVPEHGDELWGEQLWPQGPDLRNVTQQPQHVAVELLLTSALHRCTAILWMDSSCRGGSRIFSSSWLTRLYWNSRSSGMLKLHSVVDRHVGHRAYLQGPEQLAAVLYPGDVKQLVDGAVGQLRAELRVRLDGVQDLVFVLGARVGEVVYLARPMASSRCGTVQLSSMTWPEMSRDTRCTSRWTMARLHVDLVGQPAQVEQAQAAEALEVEVLLQRLPRYRVARSPPSSSVSSPHANGAPPFR